ncbi:MAG: deoxyribonuclease II family protein [Sphingomonas sp.]
MRKASGVRMIGRSALIRIVVCIAAGLLTMTSIEGAQAAPQPLAASSAPHRWIFAFKLNAQSFPTPAVPGCAFGGTRQTKQAGLQYAAANSDFTALLAGDGLIGTSLADPLGATFDEIYNSNLNFVVWNDQLYRHPVIRGCGDGCGGPWGHSKGVIAWDNAGNGIVLQVTTPSWPGSGTASFPRKGSGNTLGCIAKPNNILYSQHFFALQLSPIDTAAVLDALGNASVVTDITNAQLARIGGPAEIQARANRLGVKSNSTTLTDVMLSSGVRLLSKPSGLHVPPWQMVSARLGGVALRTATWWASPRIPSTERGRQIICWRDDLGAPGPVEVATSGRWLEKKISLMGGGNHAKLGVSTEGDHPYVIFGDLNQQGRLTGNCASSQNGRGGLFFIAEDAQLHAGLMQLMAGDTAPREIKAKPRRKRGS